MQNASLPTSLSTVKNFIERHVPAPPDDYIPRGSPARAAPSIDLDHESAPTAELPTERLSWAVSLFNRR